MKAVITIGIFGLAVASQAQVIDTYPFWDGSVTNNWNSIAQSFDAQGSVLTDYQFGIDGNPTGGGLLTVSVYNWIAGTGLTGASLYSTDVVWPGATGDVVLSGINVAMTQGSHYGVVVDLHGSSISSVHWMNNTTGNPSGHGYWKHDSDTDFSFGSLDGLSTQFKATFSSVPEPASMAVLGLGALALIRRRRITK